MYRGPADVLVEGRKAVTSKPRVAVHDEKRKSLIFYHSCLIFTFAYITVVAIDFKNLEIAF